MRAYFFCVAAGPPESSGYEHGLVALAEGFRELGIEVAGNRDIWPLAGTGEWLIPHTSEPPAAFDLVLISHESYRGRGSLSDEYVQLRGPKKIYVDESDGWRTDASSDQEWPADLVLRSHYNRHYRYPSRVRPWAFGLTNRMVESTSGGVPARDREPVVLCNFRVGHPVRDNLTTAFRGIHGAPWTWDDRIDTSPPSDPQSFQLWALTGRRHNPDYYERMRHAQGCLAFGGFFGPNGQNDIRNLWGRGLYKWIQTLHLKTSTLTQFDSWRFWESLASGTGTVHGPLDAWGAEFPVMPEDGLHYVSFGGLEDSGSFLDRWKSYLSGPGARAWAIQNYAPKPSAERLLGWLRSNP